ncbi:MAG: AAA family ATPase, partial [Candidatus Sericytochromatia bacterium]|nr:AAA family ATPase [Candidatus Tanganyikabacteria bacterium]
DPGEAGNVVYLIKEDGVADTLVPRLIAAGADVSKVAVLEGVTIVEGDKEIQAPFSLADLSILAETVRIVNPRLVVVDPIQSHLGADVDMHRANEVRPILDGLSKLAEESGFALVYIAHFNKNQGGRAAYRLMGSVDFMAAARSVLFTGRDPDDPEAFVLIHQKASLDKEAPPLGYRLVDVDGKSRVEWTGVRDISVERVLAGDPGEDDRSAVEEAEEFLREVLAGGVEVDVREVLREAKKAGHSERTLQRARRNMGLKPRPIYKDGKKGAEKWVLSLSTQFGGLNEEASNGADTPSNTDSVYPAIGGLKGEASNGDSVYPANGALKEEGIKPAQGADQGTLGLGRQTECLGDDEFQGEEVEA